MPAFIQSFFRRYGDGGESSIGPSPPPPPLPARPKAQALSSPSLRPSPPPLLAPCPPPTPVSNDAVTWELQKRSGWTEFPKWMDRIPECSVLEEPRTSPVEEAEEEEHEHAAGGAEMQSNKRSNAINGFFSHALSDLCKQIVHAEVHNKDRRRVHAERENSTKDNFGKSRQTKDTMLNGLLKLRSSSPAISLLRKEFIFNCRPYINEVGFTDTSFLGWSHPSRTLGLDASGAHRRQGQRDLAAGRVWDWVSNPRWL
ncbi:hypothetical protein EJB05_51022, partial [Eragrostis curvula]